MKKCYHCHRELDLSYFHVDRRSKDGCTCLCKECRKERDKSRKGRGGKVSLEARNKIGFRYRLKYPEKYKARQILYSAIRKGIIDRNPCAACGLTKVHGHHDDYSKPLDVVWLCQKHHREFHFALLSAVHV